MSRSLMNLDPQNIFTNVVTKENQFTELLSNLLQFPQFREATLSLFLSPKCYQEISFDDIKTQFTETDSGGIWDLVATTKKRQVHS